MSKAKGKSKGRAKTTASAAAPRSTSTDAPTGSPPVSDRLAPGQLKAQIEAAVEGARIEVVLNPAVPGQSSLVVDPAHAVAVARFLRDAEDLKLDYCSNVTGVDWPDSVVEEKVVHPERVEGGERTVEETIRHRHPGYLEVVYHLYSIPLRHGPVILRQRTANRVDDTRVASLTPVYRSAEFQEREVYDLYGVHFTGHPDPRRILMWPEFEDHPMRKDYVEPDDYEYEPTPNAEVLGKARRHYPMEGTE